MVEHLLEVIQRPRILRDRMHPEETAKITRDPEGLERLLRRVEIRRWLDTVQDELMETIIQLRAEAKFIAHLPHCYFCQMELQIDVERYLGNHSFWYLCLENSPYLERRYRSCPKERNYHIGNYWEQLQYYREHGNTDVPGENTLQFILDRAKWAYKIYGKQIRTLRLLLKTARHWNFEDDLQLCKFDEISERLARYGVVLQMT